MHRLLTHKTHHIIHDMFSDIMNAADVARYGTAHQFQKAYPGEVVRTKPVEAHLKKIGFYVQNFFAASAGKTSKS